MHTSTYKYACRYNINTLSSIIHRFVKLIYCVIISLKYFQYRVLVGTSSMWYRYLRVRTRLYNFINVIRSIQILQAIAIYICRYLVDVSIYPLRLYLELRLYNYDRMQAQLNRHFTRSILILISFSPPETTENLMRQWLLCSL